MHNKYDTALLCLSFLYERFCQVAEMARVKGGSAHTLTATTKSFEDNFDELLDIIREWRNEHGQRLFWQ